MPRVYGAPIDDSRDLKHRISADGVKWLGAELAAVRPRFPRKRFVEAALDGLEDRELKQRVDHVAAALVAVMPTDFGEAARLLDRALASPDFEGWMVYPVNAYIALAGLDHPRTALPLLARSTGRWTAEYAIRPFIESHFDLTFGYLAEWADDSDHHVRRLVSEGTRPRLPWGARLRRLVADPRPSIALLDRLIDDSSDYVRLSVANHLNDITKDHPELALKTARRWLGAGRRTPPAAHRLAIARHGLRTLVKRGDAGALGLLGFDPNAEISVISFEATPARVEIGDQVTLTLKLAGSPDSEGPRQAGDTHRGRHPGLPGGPTIPAMIDYRIHFQGARSTRAPKVFKWTTRELNSGAPLVLTRRHRFQHASVRRLYPGEHRIEVQINGRIRASTSIDLDG